MFKTEQQLVTHFTDVLESYMQGVTFSLDLECPGDVNIFTEVNLGYGIADIVVTSSKKNSKVKRNHILNYSDISIYKLIERKSKVSFESLADKTRLSKSILKVSLKKLEEESLIKFYKSEYIISKTYSPIIDYSIAFEAKLKNWKRALNQAYRYRWFANQVYVLLPEETINSAKSHIEQFHRLNVGLAAFNDKKIVEIIFSPTKEEPICDKMFTLLNEKLVYKLKF